MDALEQWFKSEGTRRTPNLYRVINTATGQVAWEAGYYNEAVTPPITAGGTFMQGHGTLTINEGDIKQPLTIKREKLIETLQGHLDEEQKKRNEAESKQAERQKRVRDAIREFNEDELENIFQQFVLHGMSSVNDIEAWVAKAKEDERFVTPAIKPSQKESDLEKYVRVLGLADNTVIEVTPSDPVYPLL